MFVGNVLLVIGILVGIFVVHIALVSGFGRSLVIQGGVRDLWKRCCLVQPGVVLP